MDAWIQWNRDGFVAGVAGAVTTAFDQRFVRVCMRVVRGWSRSRNRCKGQTHTDRQAAKWEGRFSRRLETAVACPEACRWMGALVRSRICCRQFANCWVQLPVPGGPCWDVRLWARRLEDGRGDGGGNDRSQVTGPPPLPPVWSPDDPMFFSSAAALGYSSRGGDGS